MHVRAEICRAHRGGYPKFLIFNVGRVACQVLISLLMGPRTSSEFQPSPRQTRRAVTMCFPGLRRSDVAQSPAAGRADAGHCQFVRLDGKYFAGGGARPQASLSAVKRESAKFPVDPCRSAVNPLQNSAAPEKEQRIWLSPPRGAPRLQRSRISRGRLPPTAPGSPAALGARSRDPSPTRRAPANAQRYPAGGAI